MEQGDDPGPVRLRLTPGQLTEGAAIRPGSLCTMVRVLERPSDADAYAAQVFLSRLPIRQDCAQSAPEVGRVIVFLQVHEFMNNDIVNQAYGQLEELPIEPENAVLTA